MMKKLQVYAAVLLLPLCVLINSPAVSTESRGDTSIRTVDFRNFTYPVSGVTAEITKAKSIRVRDGRFDKWWKDNEVREGSFSFSVESVTYGDINSDGKEEAVVDTSFSFMLAHQEFESRMYVFMMKGDKPALLPTPKIEDQIYNDYSKFNTSKDPCDDGVNTWTAEANSEGLLKVDAMVGNQHICYDDKKGYNMVSLYYRLENKRWVLVKGPKRWRK